ncbi:MAG TPA: hypothetical protein VFH78_15605 [Candidatus Thermoplasmatota archaeon]|nr:hypothetical protein [Candidatus Thermoplasmatota archaeon]
MHYKRPATPTEAATRLWLFNRQTEKLASSRLWGAWTQGRDYDHESVVAFCTWFRPLVQRKDPISVIRLADSYALLPECPAKADAAERVAGIVEALNHETIFTQGGQAVTAIELFENYLYGDVVHADLQRLHWLSHWGMLEEGSFSQSTVFEHMAAVVDAAIAIVGAHRNLLELVPPEPLKRPAKLIFTVSFESKLMQSDFD